MKRRYDWMIAATAAALVLAGIVAYDRATFDKRMDEAYQAGVEAADRRAEAAGGWDAYVRKSVNGWCVRNGKPLAYPGEGVIDD